MKKLFSLIIMGALFFSGCAYDNTYKGKMAPHVEKIEMGAPIPLEVGLLITQEARDRIFRSPSYPDYRGSFIIYPIEPYQLPVGNAFEEASLQTFSQIFQKVHLIRNAEEARNYSLVIEPKLADFNLSLFYFNFGPYNYNELVDGRCSIKVSGTLLSQGRPIWQKTIETPLQTQSWVNSYWLINNVSEFASDTLVLALKELAFLIKKESVGPPSAARGWLEEMGTKR